MSPVIGRSATGCRLAGTGACAGSHRAAAEGRQRRSGEAEGGPFLHRQGAELLVEVDGRLVPVQDTPFNARVAPVDGGRCQMLQQCLAVALAAGLRPDVEVLEVDPVDALPRGVVQEPEGEAADL